jgi:hypothetical protein
MAKLWLNASLPEVWWLQNMAVGGHNKVLLRRCGCHRRILRCGHSLRLLTGVYLSYGDASMLGNPQKPLGEPHQAVKAGLGNCWQGNATAIILGHAGK